MTSAQCSRAAGGISLFHDDVWFAVVKVAYADRPSALAQQQQPDSDDQKRR